MPARPPGDNNNFANCKATNPRTQDRVLGRGSVRQLPPREASGQSLAAERKDVHRGGILAGFAA